MKWPISLPPLPHIFGWSALQFIDRLKLMGFLTQAGAGVVMTGFAGYAMYQEALMKAIWPVFYLGSMAMMLVGIIVTGFAGMLIARTIEVRGPGGFVFKSQDASAAATALAGMAANTQAMPAQPPIVEATPSSQQTSTTLTSTAESTTT
jgi:hypothetical protein